MSWSALTLVGLAAVLVVGLWWYERSRPSARVLALVAALAALAVAGRLAFAPLPNVVATTDIAVLSGYALGGPAGFAVGALAAPISNIWLGQGPWTAWQMAGWGLAGAAGGALAVLSARRLGRLGLAIACAVAGLGYGLLLDLSVMVTYGGEQSLDRYLALSARGLPFNVAHAAGNFAIAFAAGPALVRMLTRYRTRFQFEWRAAGAGGGLVVLLVAVAAAAFAPSAAAAADSATRPASDSPGAGEVRAGAAAASRSALGWLVSQQNGDGGFGATAGQPSSPAMTGWVMLGLEAAGRNPLDVRNGGRSPVAYLRASADRLGGVGDLERTILALEGAGLDSRRFAGRDLVAELRARRGRDGSVRGDVNWTSFYLLAMRAAGLGRDHLARSARWLRRVQNPDGGWGFKPRAPSDPDSTGAALQALAVGGGGAAIERGVRWLRRVQTRSGGFGLATSGVVNAQSTAWAAQGLIAVGATGSALERALRYLRSLEARDGHYRYSQASDQTPIWVTAQVVLAIEGTPLPIAAVARQRGGTASGQRTPAADPDSGPADGRGAVGDRGAKPAPAATKASRRARGGSGQPAAGGSAVASLNAIEGGGEGGADAGVLAGQAAATEAEPGGGETGVYVAAGLGGLAVALAAGFVWYRRRLP